MGEFVPSTIEPSDFVKLIELEQIWWKRRKRSGLPRSTLGEASYLSGIRYRISRGSFVRVCDTRACFLGATHQAPFRAMMFLVASDVDGQWKETYDECCERSRSVVLSARNIYFHSPSHLH